jgi:hypothetical protein
MGSGVSCRDLTLKREVAIQSPSGILRALDCTRCRIPGGFGLRSSALVRWPLVMASCPELDIDRVSRPAFHFPVFLNSSTGGVWLMRVPMKFNMAVIYNCIE